MALLGHKTQAGTPLHSHWLAMHRGGTGRRPRCIHWKCLRFWDTLTLSNSTYTKYSWKPKTNLTGLISISSVRVLAITPVCRFTIFSKKGFWIKLVFTILLIPDGHDCVANATLFDACLYDGCATFRSPVTSSEVTWITWSPIWHPTHLPNLEIFIAQNNAFSIATAHVVKDAVAEVLG